MALLGSGTELDPYLLSSSEDVLQITNGASSSSKKYFKMTNDIALPFRSSSYPISTKSNISLDGNGFKFTGLDLLGNNTSSSSSNKAIFATLTYSDVKNLGIESFSIIGYQNIATLAGTGANLRLTNCYVSNSRILKYAQASDNWRYYGAFVGQLAGTDNYFTDCFVRTVFSNNEASSYTATNYLGGFIGLMSGMATFENCYFIGALNSSNSTTEGVFTPTNYTPTVIGSYSCNTGTVPINAQGSTTLVKEDFKNKENLPNFDFENTWEIDPLYNNGYPIQKVFIPTGVSNNVDVTFDVGQVDVTSTASSVIPLIVNREISFDINQSQYDVDVSSYIPIPSIYERTTFFDVNELDMISTAEFRTVISKFVDLSFDVSTIDYSVVRSRIKKLINNSFDVNETDFNSSVSVILGDVLVYGTVHLIENNDDATLLQYALNESSLIESESGGNIVAFTGDTVRLDVKFKSFEQLPIEVTDVELKIYKVSVLGNELIDTITIPIENKVGVGAYQYPYNIPSDIDLEKVKYLVYEYSATNESQPILVRGKIPLRFV